MSQLGERLREARESQGISISQAAIETRILQRYIVALEDGDFQHLPGDVYARGFIRNYAEYLSIPAEELIDLYRRERGISEPIRVVPVTSAPRVRNLMVPSFFGVFFVVLVLIGASYLMLSTLNFVGQSTQGQVAAAPTQAPTPPPLPTSAPRPTSAPELA
ncbi:MAG TPA: helix-turn-helix domain-containing protein, partial [Kouleothrix sp.]|nr:helix-turn-helix domain-containing protein [Kouleothrix sp.]